MEGEAVGVVRREREEPERASDWPVGDDGADAWSAAAFRLSGALEPREPSGGFASEGVGTSCRLRALPGAGMSGRR